MATQRDFYDILGVNKGTPPQEIKKAYRKLALEWHPDRNKSPEAEQRFKEINEAYEILSNPDKKAAYDQFGHAAFEPGGMPGGAGFGGGFGQGQTYRQGPFTYTYTTSGGGSPFEGWDFSDPFEIFEQFFGAASPLGRAARISRVGLNLTFMEAAKGCIKEIEVEGRKKQIKIPAGVDDGSRINFRDFYVTINVRPDPVFRRDGADLLVDIAFPFTLAVLGGTISVPTIEEEVRLRIRPGTQPGTMIRLRGKGLPRLQGGGRGDEYVRINVRIPGKLTPKQKKILEEFEEVYPEDKARREKSGWWF